MSLEYIDIDNIPRRDRQVKFEILQIAKKLPKGKAVKLSAKYKPNTVKTIIWSLKQMKEIDIDIISIQTTENGKKAVYLARRRNTD
jgi:hypothetical protein